MQLLFGFSGQASRGQYWIGMAVAAGAFLLTVASLAAANAPTGGGGGLVLLGLPAAIAFLWIYAAVTIKRLRDAGWATAVQILWALGPAIWLGATLELVEYIGALIAIGLIALFVIPGLLPSKTQPLAPPAEPA